MLPMLPSESQNSCASESAADKNNVIAILASKALLGLYRSAAELGCMHADATQGPAAISDHLDSLE